MRSIFVTLFYILLLGTLSGVNVEIVGDRQTGRVRSFSNDFGVIITDDKGEPITGKDVFFITDDNDLVLADSLVVSDNMGKATTYARFGGSMGDYSVRVGFSVDGVPFSEKFFFTAFDYKLLIFYLLGGLGLFLFGIRKISDTLKIIAGDRLKGILASITKNRFLGVGVGVLATCLLQSSSATTVMTIGFVNSSLLSLQQAIAVMIGANIGTTITAQIIAFRIGDFALPAIAIGAGLIIFGKKLSVRSWGNIIFGFGILFFGLNMMTDVVRPIRSSVFLSDFFLTFSHNYWLAILAGTLMTIIVQSSSATVGVTIVLAVSGLIDIYAAMALVLGDNIGTTITAVLASLGSDLNAKRTALSHVLFNAFGALYMIVLLYLFGPYIARFLDMLSLNIARQIANFHTLFNVFNTLIFLPLLPFLEYTVKRLIPERESESQVEKIVTYLNNALLEEPVIAIDQIKLELANMMSNVNQTFNESIKALNSKNSVHIDKTFYLEDKNDMYQIEITDFIVQLSQQELSRDIALRLPVLLHITNDLEKAADFSRNIAEIAERKNNKSIEFGDDQKNIIDDLSDTLNLMLENLYYSFANNDQLKAKQVECLENRLNDLEVRYKKHQVRSLSDGNSVNSAIMIMDIITNVEKAGDHLYNVAQAVMGALSEDKKALYSDIIMNNILLKGSYSR